MKTMLRALFTLMVLFAPRLRRRLARRCRAAAWTFRSRGAHGVRFGEAQGGERQVDGGHRRGRAVRVRG